MFRSDDEIYDLLSKTAAGTTPPTERDRRALLEGMYLLLVDTAERLHLSRLRKFDLHVDIEDALRVSEGWTLALCRVCCVDHDAWVDYARRRWIPPYSGM